MIFCFEYERRKDSHARPSLLLNFLTRTVRLIEDFHADSFVVYSFEFRKVIMEMETRNSRSHVGSRKGILSRYRIRVWRKEGVTLRKQIVLFQSDRMADRRHCPVIIGELLLFRCRTCARPRHGERGRMKERKKKRRKKRWPERVSDRGGGTKLESERCSFQSKKRARDRNKVVLPRSLTT